MIKQKRPNPANTLIIRLEWLIEVWRTVFLKDIIVLTAVDVDF